MLGRENTGILTRPYWPNQDKMVTMIMVMTTLFSHDDDDIDDDDGDVNDDDDDDEKDNDVNHVKNCHLYQSVKLKSKMFGVVISWNSTNSDE